MDLEELKLGMTALTRASNNLFNWSKASQSWVSAAECSLWEVSKQFIAGCEDPPMVSTHNLETPSEYGSLAMNSEVMTGSACSIVISEVCRLVTACQLPVVPS
jgi:hypothetical protein